MAFPIRSVAIASVMSLALAPSTARAQAARAVQLPAAPRLQPINVWQQSNLQQALLQQNALQQYALYQLQLQNAWLYPALPMQPNVIFSSTLPLQQPNAFQQQNAMLYSIEQLQQQNALLYGMLQQQALMQQLQQGQGAGQQNQAPQLNAR